MRKLIASEWITLDGIFDADPLHFSEWFLPYDSLARQKWIKNEIESAETLLLGRKTYEMLAPFWGSQTNDDMGPATKLNNMTKVVISNTIKESIWKNTEKIISKNIVEEIKNLKKQQGGDILISGSGKLVLTLLNVNLIDELHLLVHPTIYGKGSKLYKSEMESTKLKLIEKKDIDLGVVALSYQVTKDK